MAWTTMKILGALIAFLRTSQGAPSHDSSVACCVAELTVPRYSSR